MRFISSGHPQPRHDDLTNINNLRPLFGSQRRGGVRAEELRIIDRMRTAQEGSEKKRATNLEEKCTSEACPNEEKVWRVRNVARRVHIIQPQIEQGKGGFHALCAENQNEDEMSAR
jgi:hypothetical protein